MSQNSDIEMICFQKAPCGVLVTDREETIVRANDRLCDWLGLSEDALIGKNSESLEHQAAGGLFVDQELMRLSTPNVTDERWLLCSQQQSEESTVRFFLDVTGQVVAEEKNAALQQQVEDLTITDELTGLANPRALNRALNAQVTRSRRYNNPLCLALMELADMDDPMAVLSDDQILATSRYLRDRLRWVDTIARWDHNHFLIILPETHTEDGNALIVKISDGFSEVAAQIRNKGQRLNLHFGLAQWMKGNDSRILMDRAATNLNANILGEAESAVS